MSRKKPVTHSLSQEAHLANSQPTTKDHSTLVPTIPAEELFSVFKQEFENAEKHRIQLWIIIVILVAIQRSYNLTIDWIDLKGLNVKNGNLTVSFFVLWSPTIIFAFLLRSHISTIRMFRVRDTIKDGRASDHLLQTLIQSICQDYSSSDFRRTLAKLGWFVTVVLPFAAFEVFSMGDFFVYGRVNGQPLWRDYLTNILFCPSNWLGSGNMAIDGKPSVPYHHLVPTIYLIFAFVVMLMSVRELRHWGLKLDGRCWNWCLRKLERKRTKSLRPRRKGK